MSDDYEISAQISADTSGFTKAIEEVQAHVDTFATSLSLLSDTTKKSTEDMANGLKSVGGSAKQTESEFSSATEGIKGGLESWGISLDKMYEEGSSIFKKFGIDIDQFASKIGTTGPRLATGIGIGLVEFEKLKEIISETTKEFAEDETAELKFTGAMSNNSNMTKENREILEAFVGSLSKMTGESISATQSQLTMSVAMGRTNEQIQRMANTALGMANSGIGSFEGNMQMLNQTLEGSKGKLGKYSDEVAILTKNQLEHGDAIDILAKKYGDMADTIESSTAVSISRNEHAWGEFSSMLGSFFEETIKPLRDGITSIVDYLVAHKEETIGVIEGIGVAVSFLLAMINPILGGINLLVVGFFSISHAAGGLKILWLEIEQGFLIIVKGVSDAISVMANGIIGTINWLTGKINVVLKALHQTLLDPISKEDASKAWGVDDALASVSDQMAKAKSKKEESPPAGLKFTPEELTNIESMNKALETYNKTLSDIANESADDLMSPKDALDANIKAAEEYAKALSDAGNQGQAALNDLMPKLEALYQKQKDLNLISQGSDVNITRDQVALNANGMLSPQDLALKSHYNNPANFQGSNNPNYGSRDNSAIGQFNDMVYDFKEKIRVAGVNLADSFVELKVKISTPGESIKQALAKLAVSFVDFVKDVGAEVKKSMGTYISSGVSSANSKIAKDSSLTDAQKEKKEKQTSDAGDLMSNIASQGVAMGTAMWAINKVLGKMFEVLAPVVGEILEPLSDALESVGELAGELLVPVFELLGPIIKFLADSIMGQVNAIKGFFNGIIDAMNWALDWIPGYDDIPNIGGGATSTDSTSTSNATSFLGGYASGTDSASEGIHLVGEQGPELAYLPQGTKVMNAKDTASALSKSTQINYNITTPKPLNESAIAAMARKTQRQMAFSGAI